MHSPDYGPRYWITIFWWFLCNVRMRQPHLEAAIREKHTTLRWSLPKLRRGLLRHRSRVTSASAPLLNAAAVISSFLPLRWCLINLLSSALRQAHVGHSGERERGHLSSWGSREIGRHTSIFNSPFSMPCISKIWTGRPSSNEVTQGLLAARQGEGRWEGRSACQLLRPILCLQTVDVSLCLLQHSYKLFMQCASRMWSITTGTFICVKWSQSSWTCRGSDVLQAYFYAVLEKRT